MTRDEMLAIMQRLDDRAKTLLADGGGDTGLLTGMFDDMPLFKALLDSPYSDEINVAARRFPAFHRYASVLSNIAGGIASGSIKVPN
jgi:hypothetical protein